MKMKKKKNKQNIQNPFYILLIIRHTFFLSTKTNNTPEADSSRPFLFRFFPRFFWRDSE